jgi:hypothetical protein
MGQRLQRYVVVFLPVAGAAAAILVGLARVKWPSEAFWSGKGTVIALAIIAAGVVPVVQTGISEYGEKKRRKELERKDDVRSLLVPSLVYAVRHCDAPWDLTGVQAFMVRGWWFRKHQVRVAKVRLASAPQSGVRWSEGKGVIGRCWETHASQIVQLDQPPFSELSEVQEPHWLEIDAGVRYGLSYADYRALGAKYGTIAAVPMINDSGGYLGCITLDMPPGQDLEDQDGALESLATTADLVRRLLRS